MYPLLAVLLAAAPGPNVVFIHADDLGPYDLGCYGRKDHNTPNLDRLAKQGLRFTSAYCSLPICSASRAGLMTGKWPARLHLTTYLPGRPDAPSQKLLHPKIRMQLPLEEKTLGEYFKEAGYATACIGKWHLGHKGFTPDKQGFDVVFAGRGNTKPSATEGGKGEYGLTRKAIGFMEANAGKKPFFLYLAHWAPHIPLAAKPELVRKNREAFNPVYAAVVETLDDSVGMVLKKLDELKLADDTIVVFISDHGGLHVPELKEDAATHNTPYRAGKGFLYEGGLRVPFLMRWPGKLKPGVVPHPVINTDFVPTLLEMAGREAPKGLDGMSWAKAALGKGDWPTRPLYWHFPHYNNQGGRPAGAMRLGDWKLVEHYDTGKAELYDLAKDIGEEHDLAAKEPGRLKKMRDALAAWRKAIGAQENAKNPAFDEKLWRKLYAETDVSKLKPAKTAAEMTPGLKEWRRLMDDVVRRK